MRAVLPVVAARLVIRLCCPCFIGSSRSSPIRGGELSLAQRFSSQSVSVLDPSVLTAGSQPVALAGFRAEGRFDVIPGKPGQTCRLVGTAFSRARRQGLQSPARQEDLWTLSSRAEMWRFPSISASML